MDIIVFGVSLCKYVLFFFPFFFRVWQTSQKRLPRSPGEESLVMEGAMMGGYEEAQGDYGGVGMDEYVCERERREGRVCVDGPSTCHTGWRSQPTSEWFWVNNVPAHAPRHALRYAVGQDYMARGTIASPEIEGVLEKKEKGWFRTKWKMFYFKVRSLVWVRLLRVCPSD